MNAVSGNCDDPLPGMLSMLSADEEMTLCRRWHELHDVDAAGRLVRSHLHLVAEIAMAYQGCGMLVQELVGEGYFGLMRAVCRYDPACGTPFTTYATRWVQTAIQQSVLRAAPPMRAVTAETATAMLPPRACGREQYAFVQFVM